MIGLEVTAWLNTIICEKVNALNAAKYGLGTGTLVHLGPGSLVNASTLSATNGMHNGGRVGDARGPKRLNTEDICLEENDHSPRVIDTATV